MGRSSMGFPESAAAFMSRQVERLRNAPKRRKIVFPEGDDARVLKPRRTWPARRWSSPS